MDDLGVGRLIRLTRIRRAWTQLELATRASVSRTAVSRVERGHLGEISLDTVRAIAKVLDVRVEVKPRARAIDIDRVLNARHSALAEFLIGWFSRISGWVVWREVSFSEFGERGAIDLLCWHAPTRSLLVVEVKTELIDFGELLAVLGMKHRLASKVARQFGWDPLVVSSCLLVADSMTNRRRAADHRALLGAALPLDGRGLPRWLKSPAGEVRALRFVTDVRPGHVRSGFAGRTRVRPARAGVPSGNPRSPERAIGSRPPAPGRDGRLDGT